MRPPGKQRGFTMVELVMVIVLTGILGSMSMMFIVEPMRAYVDQSRRAALVDEAEISLRRMGRELRAAVPNSVLVTGQTLQFYNAVSGGRYRASGPHADGAAAILDFTTADTSFDVPGGFPGATIANPSPYRVVIFSLGTPGSSVYDATDTVMSPAGTVVGLAPATDPGTVRVTLTPGYRFPYASPQHRVYLADAQPVAYACAGGTLTRNAQIVTANVTACSFTYNPGSETRSGLATLNITLSRDGESVTLLRQVRLENLP